MSVTLNEFSEDEDLAGLGPDGRPDPDYAARLGLIPAPVGRRAGAFGIDAVVLAVAYVPAAFAIPELVDSIASGNPRPPLLLFVSVGLTTIVSLVQLLLHGRKGFTLGKRALGIRTVRTTTLGVPGFWRTVLRALMVQASSVIMPVLGAIAFLLSPLWDSERRGRGWHDHLVGVWLIDVRSGLDPYDPKALRHAKRQLEAPATVEVAGLPSLASSAGSSVSFVPGARLSDAVVGAPPPGTRESHDPAVSEPQAATSASVAQPVVASPPLAGRQPSAVVSFDNGTRLEISGTGLIGRNPAPEEGEQFDGLLRVADETSSISKTHASFAVDEGGFWITDRSSTNGTGVGDTANDADPLEPGHKRAIPWGATVWLGDRYFVVTRA